MAGGLLGVITLTVATGGDNIAAYTSLFRTISVGAAAITVGVFTVGVALWCLTGFWLVTHHTVTGLIQRWGHSAIPVIYILIGLYIFYKAGIMQR